MNHHVPAGWRCTRDDHRAGPCALVRSGARGWLITALRAAADRLEVGPTPAGRLDLWTLAVVLMVAGAACRPWPLLASSLAATSVLAFFGWYAHVRLPRRERDR